jgi:hypothetical protein
MSGLAVPFNITLLELTPEDLTRMKPVRSLDLFEPSSRNFHEDGLFSVSIFGRVGDVRRSRRFSYIDLKIGVFHPIIYRALGQLKRFYHDIILGRVYAVWDDQLKDFVKSDAFDGRTGFQFFIEHWQGIEFEHRPSDSREHNIKLIEMYKKKALTDKLVVMPAGMRDIEITGGRIVIDEVNELYRRILSITNSIHKDAVQNNPEILNMARISLQRTFNEIFELFERMVEGKKKLLMGKWAARRVFNGTRNVITSMNMVSNKLDNPGNIGLNDTVIGLYQFMKGALPVAKFHIKTGFLSKVFTGPHSPATLVNKTTLKAESVNLRPEYFDSWMTEEGLEKVISAFAEESIRHKPLEIEGRYVGLIYKGPEGFVKLFQDIDDLPAHFDKEYVTPVTFCELLYMSVYGVANTLPIFVTRYPVTGMGSIYPSMVHLKPTVKTEHRKVLNEFWELDPSIPDAYEFPTNSSFVNAMSPHPTHLSALGAD